MKNIPDSDVKRLWISGVKMVLLLGLLWILFYFVHIQLPYIRAGHEVIYSSKIETLCPSIRFSENTRYKVVVFGNSMILSGFVPSLFDAENDHVRSYNLALPQEEQFLFALDFLVENNQIPTHVLLTSGWSDRLDEPADHGPSKDGRIIEELFPFRHLPRNLTLFLLRSRSRGGVAEYYRHGKESVERMLAARGYYFIEGQSHFPDDRLPDGFRLQGDNPDLVYRRSFDTKSYVFKKLNEFHKKYNMKFYIIPTYLREGSYAKCQGENPNAELFTAHPWIKVLGPEYYILANPYFSDPIHANPEGARLYTQKISALCKEVIFSE
ncbi:MAG: hypothetical protein JXA82_19225 [Sedimentisphaerales bacterium]|nr:hypothetical protein [Sedimentisphaerales bacterium]